MAEAPLFIISGPSGCGKSTLVRRIITTLKNKLRLAVSATTRSPRRGEIDGAHYHFWSREQFASEIAAGNLVEHAEVFGNLYGTPKSEVDFFRAQGLGVLLEIDVQGAALVRAKYPDALSIFIRAPSRDAYEKRLVGRGTEDDAALQRRLQGAEQEESRKGEFDHVVVNDDLELAERELIGIINGVFS